MIVWHSRPNRCLACGCVGCRCRRAPSRGFEVGVKVSLHIDLLKLWNVEGMAELARKPPLLFTSFDVRDRV